MFRLLSLLILLLLPIGASAQRCTLDQPRCQKPAAVAPTGQWIGDVVAELQSLGLTEAQKVRLIRIAMDARSRQATISADQDEFRDEAADALQTGTADLFALAASREDLTDRRLAATRQTRDELLAFYATLSPAQQAQVQRWIATALDRIDAFRVVLDSFTSSTRF